MQKINMLDQQVLFGYKNNLSKKEDPVYPSNGQNILQYYQKNMQ